MVVRITVMLFVSRQIPGYTMIPAMVSLRFDGVWAALTILLMLGAHFVAALFASQN